MAWVGVDHPRYKWVALSNTTLGTLIATINTSIVLISLPAIFNGLRLDPLQPDNVSYLLWMLMGYMLITAVLVVTLGRLGDIWGRVRIYNAGFLIFTVTSVVLSLDPYHGGTGALWLIGWRVAQAIGGSMLMANSAAIITDAFPSRQRGMALGVNMVAGIAGSFIGLVLGGLLAEWNWRSIFWVNVPIGVLGTLWAYRSLHEAGVRKPARMDWWGNITFAVGLTALLAGITYGIQPYRGHTMGWTNPWVLAGLIGGAVVLAVFCLVESRVTEPMFPLGLFRNAMFAGGNTATLLGSIARGGLQFMLIIWLQGIWLPLHGYDYADTPLWAGIYLVPLTVGFLAAGPVAGHLSDRLGARLFAAAGFVAMAASFAGLLLLPTDFGYPLFAFLVFLNGIGGGLYAAPNTSVIMSSVPADARGAASGMRATFQNAGMVLSIGVFFSLMVAGLAGSLPGTLTAGLTAQGVPAHAAHALAGVPPVGVLFAAFLGYNPIQQLLGPHVLGALPASNARTLTGREFFPHLISGPFHNGLVVVFSLAIAMALVAAAASLIRGRTAPATPDLPVQSIPGTRISGVLRDGASAALPRAALTLVDPNGRQIARGTARGDGSYELTVPAPGSYVLIAAADGHQPQAVPVAVDGHTLSRDLTLAALRPGARIRGTVRAASSGRPLADARVTLVDAEGEAVATRTTGPDGSYGFTGLAAGEYTVIARGYSPVSTAVTLDGMGESGFDLLLGRADEADT
ncbi:MFS transporter [Streptomyces humicola]|uniref:MFS transporter n=1 Tax=Streptomyces humicola TaxID=2953240 RepID=UPI0035562351